jgi:hypothetical protein
MSYRVSAKSLEMLRNGHITAHNLKVVGSNPTPATKISRNLNRLRDF